MPKTPIAAPADEPGDGKPRKRRTYKRANGEGTIYQRKDGRWEGAELAPVRRTRRVWGQAPGSGDLSRVSNSAGLSIPILECRRLGLYQHSIHSKMAFASSFLVFHAFRSRSSSCIVPQNDSIIELS